MFLKISTNLRSWGKGTDKLETIKKNEKSSHFDTMKAPAFRIKP